MLRAHRTQFKTTDGPTFTDLTPQRVLPTTTNIFFFFNRSPYRLTRQRKSKKAMEMADQQKLPR
jgi:hypothetical protein